MEGKGGRQEASSNAKGRGGGEAKLRFNEMNETKRYKMYCIEMSQLELTPMKMN